MEQEQRATSSEGQLGGSVYQMGVSGGQAETVGVPCHGLSSSSHLEIVGFPVWRFWHPRASPPVSDGEV